MCAPLLRARGPPPLLLAALLASGAVGAAGRHDEVCLPRWYREQRDKLDADGNSTAEIRCPYGVRLMGDVTWPTRPRGTLAEKSICVFYGYVPVLVIGTAVLEFLVVRGTRELFFVLFVALTTTVNEVILKGMLHQPRPGLSCCTTCGMPSSHSTFALGFYTLMFLDAASRVNPMDVGREPAHTLAMLLQREIAFLRGPLSNPVTLSNRAFIVVCSQWGVLLLPVPLSRIYLKDHSVAQVVAGCVVGVAYAFIFYYGLYEPFARQMRHQENWRWPNGKAGQRYLLINTVKLPWWRQEVTLENMAISDGESDCCLVHGRSLVSVHIPFATIEEVEGGQRALVHGQRLQVVGGKWAGVAWPVHGTGQEALSLENRGDTPKSPLEVSEEDHCEHEDKDSETDDTQTEEHHSRC